MGMMQMAGAAAFTDDGKGVEDSLIMQRAMQYGSMIGAVLMQHCEDPSLFGGSMNSGAVAVRLGLGGIPSACEEIMLQRDLELVRRIGCRYHVQHVSSAGSMIMIRIAKAEGLPVTAEATPHHLLLTDAACVDYDTLYKVNPPLRTIEDVEAIRLGVADGTIDCLASDHAPHTCEEKDQEFALAPFGMISIEAALGLYAKALVESSMCDWPILIERMTANPARAIGSELGTLGVGSPADVTIIDPKKRWTVRVDKFESKSRNCPYDGWELTGRAITTIVDGEVKFRL
jgi:dihydroorotase